MGTKSTSRGSRKIECSISAPCRVERIVVVKNGKPLCEETGTAWNEEYSTDDFRERDTDSYYIKVVLEDGRRRGEVL